MGNIITHETLIRVITINPYLKAITVEMIGPDLESLRHAIGGNNIELVYLENDNIMYVDEEGLFKEDQKYFTIGGLPFAGKAIILGDDQYEGKTIGTEVEISEIAKAVNF